jgi:hypothetical protein
LAGSDGIAADLLGGRLAAVRAILVLLPNRGWDARSTPHGRPAEFGATVDGEASKASLARKDG